MESDMKMVCVSAVIILAATSMFPLPVTAQVADAPSYAEQQCGAGAYQLRGYPSYESCYSAAISYYYSQTGGGVGGETGPGGGGGGTWIGDIPGYDPGNQWPCGSRLCDDGQQPQ